MKKRDSFLNQRDFAHLACGARANCSCSEQLELLAAAMCHSPSAPPETLQHVPSPDISIRSCASQRMILMPCRYCVDRCSRSGPQRQRSPCCCTGSCCSGRTGPCGISSTIRVRASGSGRRTSAVKSCTTSTRGRQVFPVFLFVFVPVSPVSLVPPSHCAKNKLYKCIDVKIKKHKSFKYLKVLVL